MKKRRALTVSNTFRSSCGLMIPFTFIGCTQANENYFITITKLRHTQSLYSTKRYSVDNDEPLPVADTSLITLLFHVVHTVKLATTSKELLL